MLQGPKPYEAVNAPQPAALPGVPGQRHKAASLAAPGAINPGPLVQAADVVQLSPNAVLAAGAAVKALPGPAPAVPLPQVAGPAPAISFTPPVSNGTPPAPPQQPLPPMHNLAAAEQVKALLAAVPEVRPSQVQQAIDNLKAGLPQSSGAVNAVVAQKLLTGF